jgi:hypothetical protein
MFSSLPTELYALITEAADMPTRAVIFGVSSTFRCACKGLEIRKTVVKAALDVPHNDVWRWLVEKGYYIDSKTIRNATKAGNFAILKYFSRYHFKVNPIPATFSPDQPEIRQLLLDQGYTMNNEEVRQSMVRADRLDLFQQYSKTIFKIGVNDIEIAAKHSFRIFVWLTGTPQFSPHQKLVDYAVKGNQPEIVHFLTTKYPNLVPLSADLAARRGDLATLKNLRASGHIFSIATTGQAIRGNHLSIVKWLRKVGAPYDARSLNKALLKGRTEIVDYYLLCHCPTDDNTPSAALCGNRYDLIHILKLNLQKTAQAALNGGYLDVLKDLKNRGVLSLRCYLDTAIAAGHFEVVN